MYEAFAGSHTASCISSRHIMSAANKEAPPMAMLVLYQVSKIAAAMHGLLKVTPGENPGKGP